MNKKTETVVPALRIARIKRKFLELLANLHIEDVYAIDSGLLADMKEFQNHPLQELWELESVVDRTRGNRRFLELYAMVEFAIYESAFLKNLLLTSTKKNTVIELTKDDLIKPIYIEKTRDTAVKNADSEYKKLFIEVVNGIGSLKDEDGWVGFLKNNDLRIYNFFQDQRNDLLESLSFRDFRSTYSNGERQTINTTSFHFKELKCYIDAMQEEGHDTFSYFQIKAILFDEKKLNLQETLDYLEPLRKIRNCLIHDFGWPKRKLLFFNETYDVGSDICLPFYSNSKHYTVLVNTFLTAYHWYFALIQKFEGGDDFGDLFDSSTDL